MVSFLSYVIRKYFPQKYRLLSLHELLFFGGLLVDLKLHYYSQSSITKIMKTSSLLIFWRIPPLFHPHFIYNWERETTELINSARGEYILNLKCYYCWQFNKRDTIEEFMEALEIDWSNFQHAVFHSWTKPKLYFLPPLCRSQHLTGNRYFSRSFLALSIPINF